MIVLAEGIALMQPLRRLLVAVIATCALVACAVPAPANHLAMLSSFSVASEGEIVFSSEETGIEEALISCPMTLSGGFVTEAFEETGATFGYIGLPIVGECAIGTFQGLLGPNGKYPFQDSTLLGREHLPREPERVTGLLGEIVNLAFQITRGLLTCLYIGNVGVLINYSWEATDRSWVEGAWAILRSSTVTLSSGSALCPRRGLVWAGRFRPVAPKEWKPA
jgi:hypothetical protein